MLIETVDLTFSQLGLSNLTEYALLTLFASAQAHCITSGTGLSLGDIVDQRGQLLYPAYYMTHLTVPPNRLLETYRLWEQVCVGVDVGSFGGMLIDSSYILGRPGEIGEDPAGWDLAAYPAMRAGALFVVDQREGETVSIPKAKHIADLPRRAAQPASMARFREVRLQGSLANGMQATLRPQAPILYPVIAGRDLAPRHSRIYAGHAMVFAKFVEIMDYAERVLLGEHVWPPFPSLLLECRTVLEREIYYFGTCEEERVLRAAIAGQLRRCPANLHGSSSEKVSAAVLDCAIELYEQGSNRLLAVARVKKLFVVPSTQQNALRDMERLIAHYTA